MKRQACLIVSKQFQLTVCANTLVVGLHISSLSHYLPKLTNLAHKIICPKHFFTSTVILFTHSRDVEEIFHFSAFFLRHHFTATRKN